LTPFEAMSKSFAKPFARGQYHLQQPEIICNSNIVCWSDKKKNLLRQKKKNIHVASPEKKHSRLILVGRRKKLN